MVIGGRDSQRGSAAGSGGLSIKGVSTPTGIGRVKNSPCTRRWIPVAGTGKKVGTPEVDILAAKAIGKELATLRYGLITGGWHGVDYVVVLVQRELEASSFRLSSIL